METSELVVHFLGSMLLGLSVAAPIGPINIEIIRRGLTQSSLAAFAMGCGAVSADCAYLSLALVGAGWVSAAGESALWRVAGLLLGASMLTWLGIGAIRKAGLFQGVVTFKFRSEGGNLHRPLEESAIRIYFVGLALTLANPMTIALWLSIAAGFAASAGEAGRPFIRIAGVFCGALSWVCFMTGMTAGARRWINPLMIRFINVLSGLFLIGYGARFAVRVFNI